jgi:hypothetical protein
LKWSKEGLIYREGNIDMMMSNIGWKTLPVAFSETVSTVGTVASSPC